MNKIFKLFTIMAALLSVTACIVTDDGYYNDRPRRRPYYHNDRYYPSRPHHRPPMRPDRPHRPPSRPPYTPIPSGPPPRIP